MSWTPTTLVLGPGGVKGFLEVGALQALEVFLMLKDLRRIIGVSIGAVIGLLLAAGLSPAKIAKHAKKVDLLNQVFVMKPFSRDGFLSNGGFFSREGIRAYLGEVVARKFARVPTLAQLYELTGTELIVVTTNVSRCEPAYLSHRTVPGLSCVEAVLMSINIPLVFEYYELDGERYADGALSDPMPVQLYPDENQLVLRIIDMAGQQSSLLSYVYAAFSVPMDYMAKEKLSRMMASADFGARCRVIDLIAQNFIAVNPIMTDCEKQSMINQGKKTAAEYIILSELRARRDANTENDTRDYRTFKVHAGVHLRERLRPLSQLHDKPTRPAEV